MATKIFSIPSKTHYRKEIACHQDMIDHEERVMRSAFAARHGEYQWTPEEARKRFNKAKKLRKYWQKRLAQSAKKYSALFN